MATMTIQDVAKEINTFLSHNTTLIPNSINKEASTLDKYTKPLTKVKGKYPQGHSLLTNVVQGFEPVWNALGSTQIKHKILENYHQKVNFPIRPAEILASYWAELYAENKKPQDMPISKYIIERELLPKVIDDLAELEITGSYDAANLDVFGNSMNGIETIITNMLAADPATDPTPFKIPINPLTDANIVDEVTSYERQLHTKTKKKIKRVFMSENNEERYWLRYEDQFGQNQFQKEKGKTRLGKREIVGLPFYTGDDIFATVEGNFVRLIDVFDGKPTVTDVQVQDYDIKIFMEFWKGYQFLIDELVYVSNYADAEYGLGSTAKNQLYYGFDGVSIP